MVKVKESELSAELRTFLKKNQSVILGNVRPQEKLGRNSCDCCGLNVSSFREDNRVPKGICLSLEDTSDIVSYPEVVSDSFKLLDGTTIFVRALNVVDLNYSERIPTYTFDISLQKIVVNNFIINKLVAAFGRHNSFLNGSPILHDYHNSQILQVELDKKYTFKDILLESNVKEFVCVEHKGQNADWITKINAENFLECTYSIDFHNYPYSDPEEIPGPNYLTFKHFKVNL